MKQNISLAPNNPSAWNYLRGVLDHNKIPYATLQAFVTPYSIAQPVGDDEVVDLDHPLPSKTAELPCAAAIEFLADVYEREGGDSVHKATQVGDPPLVASRSQSTDVNTLRTALEILSRRA